MQAEKRESTGFGELYVGFAESAVVAVCPNKEELEKLGYTPEEEPVYTSEKEGIDRVRLDFYMSEAKNGVRFKKSYFLENSPVVQKVKDDWDDEKIADFIPKTQYVNCTGDSQWVAEESDLPQRFTNFTKKNKSTDEVEVYGDKEYRVALQGEADLLDFINKWLGNINRASANTNILLDMKKIFAGNFKELTEHVGGELQTNTVELLQVKTVEKDDELKTYQSVWRTSLPGYTAAKVRATKFTPENIEAWSAAKKTKDNPSGRYLKNYEQFAIDITGEWGSKDYFELVPMKLYNEEEDKVGKGSPVPTDASY